MTPPAFVCPICHRQSWNRNDAVHGFCGNCGFVDRLSTADIGAIRSLAAPALPIARADLARASFPFTIEAYSARDGSVVWSRVVTGAGPVTIPPLAKQIGCPIGIRVLWPDGSIQDTPPPDP